MPSSLPVRLKNDPMSNEKGVSLVESLLVIFAVGFIVLLLANLPNAMFLINKSKHLSLAREIAVKQLEDKRSTSYANLVNGSSAITDTRITSLPDGSGTIEVEDCDENICTSQERIKQVNVTINWQESAKPQTVSLETFIGEGGLNQ
ncbi:hypothetical protein HYT18_04650 [Candidatus Microgenomates bacterium]|nr:hypothetical protein [Candidatus Microgenomates bacterium]